MEALLEDRVRSTDALVIVENCIDYSKIHDGVERREICDIEGVMVHQVAPRIGHDVHSLQSSFLDTSTKYSAGSYTGGIMPYTFVLMRGGSPMIQQSAPVTAVLPHARSHSSSYVSLAVIGDFNQHPIAVGQWNGLVSFCCVLKQMFGQCLKIVGHTEVSGASSDPKKVCPGKFLSMDKLRDEVDDRVQAAKLFMMDRTGMS